MKRLLSLAIIALLIFAVGCSQTAEEEVVPEYAIDGEEGEIDLEGMTFRFCSPWVDEYAPVSGYSAAGDKMLARYKQMEQELNITIQIDEVGDESSFITRDVAAGLPTYDLMDMHSPHAMNLYVGGYCFPLNEISTIDLTEEYKYSPAEFRRYGVYKGNSYGFYPWAWEFIPQFEGVMLFNNELILKYGFRNPYEMQESGDWTWDGFKEELENIQTIVSTESTTIYPFVRNANDRLGRTVILSNGVDIVKEDEDGKLTFNLDCEAAYKALEYIHELDALKLARTGDMPEFSVNAQGVYCSCESYHGTLHAETEQDEPSYNLNDYGMLEFPKGPNATEDSCSAYVLHGRRLLWVASMSENDPEEIGVVIDRMFEPLEGDSKDVPAWKEYAERMIFHHPEGFDNFERMIDNIKYDYSVELNKSFSQLTNAFADAISGKMTGAQAISQVADLMQQTLDEYMASYSN